MAEALAGGDFPPGVVHFGAAWRSVATAAADAQRSEAIYMRI